MEALRFSTFDCLFLKYHSTTVDLMDVAKDSLYTTKIDNSLK